MNKAQDMAPNTIADLEAPQLIWVKLEPRRYVSRTFANTVVVEYDHDLPPEARWMLYTLDRFGVVLADFESFHTMGDARHMAQTLAAQNVLDSERS